MDEVYANMAGVEAGVSSSAVLSLPWRSRQLILVNDSSVTDVEVKVGSGPSFHLRALETMSINVWVESVWVSASTSATFRAIGIG